MDIFRGDITSKDDPLCGDNNGEIKIAPCKVGRFCGTNSPGRLLSELDTEEYSNLILQFRTGFSVRKEGFQFTYRQIGKFSLINPFEFLSFSFANIPL